MKLKLTLLALITPLALCAMQNNDMIQGASYYIIKGNETSLFQVIGAANTHVTFYDANGNELKQLSREECDIFHVERKLDPAAPKPKVATYAIKWWPAIPVKFLWIKATKGVPGYFLVLKDKHGNYIERFRYDEQTKKIAVSFDPNDPKNKIDSIYDLKNFDTSNCVEQDSDPITDRS